MHDNMPPVRDTAVDGGDVLLWLLLLVAVVALFLLVYQVMFRTSRGGRPTPASETSGRDGETARSSGSGLSSTGGRMESEGTSAPR